jgi:hypothetical protein
VLFRLRAVLCRQLGDTRLSGKMFITRRSADTRQNIRRSELPETEAFGQLFCFLQDFFFYYLWKKSYKK